VLKDYIFNEFSSENIYVGCQNNYYNRLFAQVSTIQIINFNISIFISNNNILIKFTTYNIPQSPHNSTLSHVFLYNFVQLDIKPLGTLRPIYGTGVKSPSKMPNFIFIQQISVLKILTMLYNLHFFPLQNAVYFIKLHCLVSVLLTF
jgi:hypothetical protein